MGHVVPTQDIELEQQIQVCFVSSMSNSTKVVLI